MHALVLIALQIIALICTARQTRRGGQSAPQKTGRLAVALNILLGVLVVPAGLCALLGMAEDGIYAGMPIGLHLLYTAITALGYSAAPTVLLSLMHATLLHRRGKTRLGYTMQCLPLAHLLLLGLLVILPV